MAKNNTQGQSKTTEFKERGLQAAFSINTKVFVSLKNKYKKDWRYFHFDLNSGCGFNNEAGCIGSPIAFIEAARMSGCEKYFAAFCDIKSEYLEELSKRDHILNNYNCFLFNGDNSSLVYAIPSIISVFENPRHAIGMVLSDPNGSTGIPLEGLEWLSREAPKIDFCLNWSSGQFKRDRGAFGDQRPTMEQAIERMNKKYWLIRNPMGAFQWTLLIGRNTKIGDHPSLGFYHLDSEKGQAIFNKCNLTREEKNKLVAQHNLFGEAA